MFSASHATEQGFYASHTKEQGFYAQLCGNANGAARVPTQPASTEAQVKSGAGCTQVWTAHTMRSL